MNVLVRTSEVVMKCNLVFVYYRNEFTSFYFLQVPSSSVHASTCRLMNMDNIVSVTITAPIRRKMYWVRIGVCLIIMNFFLVCWIHQFTSIFFACLVFRLQLLDSSAAALLYEKKNRGPRFTRNRERRKICRERSRLLLQLRELTSGSVEGTLVKVPELRNENARSTFFATHFFCFSG